MTSFADDARMPAVGRPPVSGALPRGPLSKSSCWLGYRPGPLPSMIHQPSRLQSTIRRATRSPTRPRAAGCRSSTELLSLAATTVVGLTIPVAVGSAHSGPGPARRLTTCDADIVIGPAPIAAAPAPAAPAVVPVRHYRAAVARTWSVTGPRPIARARSIARAWSIAGPRTEPLGRDTDWHSRKHTQHC